MSVLAHDLRNLVSPVSARLQLLLRRATSDGRERDVRDADAAVRAVTRLNALIDDMLDVTRIDHGMLRLDVEPVNLSKLASEIAATLSTPLHEIRQAPAEDVIVDADPSRLRQCLENVVVNAIQHSPRGAPVALFVSKWRRDDGEVGRVEVLDEGPGIPGEMLPHIFERFVVGPGSRGLGMGLYLAKRIAVAHGGRLAAESLPERGARFCLDLPLSRAA
jgi:signal transduction histidine kinase